MDRAQAFAAISLAALSACATGWQTRTFDGGGYRFKAGDFDIDDMQASALAAPGARSTSRDDRIEVLVPKSHQLYLFTLDANAAHPSVIIMNLEPHMTPFKAYSGAALTNFDAWLLAVAKERDQILSRYR